MFEWRIESPGSDTQLNFDLNFDCSIDVFLKYYPVGMVLECILR